MATTRVYNVLAVSTTIWFNKYGDHDHNGLIYILKEHKPILNYVEKMQAYKPPAPGQPDTLPGLMQLRNQLITAFGLTGDINRINEWLPDTKAKARRPHPLIVPLVLRAAKGDTVKVSLTNEVKNRLVSIHLVGPGTDINSDGTKIWDSPGTRAAYQETINYTWACQHEGIFVFHDAGDFRGDEKGTNTHGLFGGLVVEPANSSWTDPENKSIPLKSGLYADVHQRTAAELNSVAKAPYPKRDNLVAPNANALTKAYPEPKASFREYVIFIHDEPEWVPPHDELQPNPCQSNASQHELAHAHTEGSLMPISYRAEPMISRERKLWKLMEEGKIDPNNIVVNEEQHHSCWLFGEPDTPVLKAYLGDPVRIRLVHAGVKETHVFHLHVYEWNAVVGNPNTNLIDAVTISPQTGHTIQPLYGAGNRQMVPGDVIWHCHLYPHFHHGMWGIFRVFDRLQNGQVGATFNGDTGGAIPADFYNGLTGWDLQRKKNRFERQLGFYPDGTPINRLEPLPDREAPPIQDLPNKKLGYPHFISGEFGQKSFNPPWHKAKTAAATEGWAVGDYDYRDPSALELNAFNIDPKPGELFTAFPHNDSPQSVHTDEKTNARLKPSATVKHDLDVLMTPLKYNDHGWWDPHGHLFALKGHGIKTFSEVVHDAFHDKVHELQHHDPTLTEDQAKAVARLEGVDLEPTEQVPLFFRCNKTNVMQLTLHNRLEKYIAGTPFDSSWPKFKQELNCDKFENYKGECGLHVHIVKFDPIACDGASTGWNYMSAPSFNKKAVYRWWADDEFGVIFSHDHCFANFRQKHGLFAALLVEPENATFHDPTDHTKHIIDGTEAVIKYKEVDNTEKVHREFCLANGDWVPLFKKETAEAHAPAAGGHVDAHAAEGGFVANAFFTAHGSLSTINVNYGIPIEAPDHQDSHDDNGVFGVNYKCEPLAERPHEPSEWFSSKPFTLEGEHDQPAQTIEYGDPATPIFRTFEGEPIRLRLVQGSHEEQHSFQLHGMKWRRFWKDPQSILKNQQTLGISEAFSFDIFQKDNLNYPAGDYLWKYASAEDLWLGTWGFIRAFERGDANSGDLVPIQNNTPAFATRPADAQCRRFKVETIARTIPYNAAVADPFGLVYRLTDLAEPNGAFKKINHAFEPFEPLVIRCRRGEWIAVTVKNAIPTDLEAEPMAPRLPHDDAGRVVSKKVSLHADMLYGDVKNSDGANVGLNPNTTIDNGGERTYYWYADTVGAFLLQDMADFRNHRHHGLIGAVVVHSETITPYKVLKDAPTAVVNTGNIRWYGTRVTLRNQSGSLLVEDQVLLIQDGLRYFLHGNPAMPIGDMPADLGEGLPDTEDQGLKGVNYKSEPTSFERGFAFRPETPIMTVKVNATLQMHLLGACDKPRNHSFTIHGHSWDEWLYPDMNNSPQMSSMGGISSGFAKTFQFKANGVKGKYMYRSGVLKYVVEQGLWGVINVV